MDTHWRTATALGLVNHERNKENKVDTVIREGSKGDAERPGPDEHVTMTRAELDVLIAEHEAKARKDTPPT